MGETRTADVVVVGGGPAGMVTAVELARGGLDVVLVEEQAELGGQYYKRRHPQVQARHGDFRPAGSQLVNAVRAGGVTVLSGHLVWGVADDGRTLLVHPGQDASTLRLQATVVVLATGAYEQVLPFAGWQLPGVTTAGFALHLATMDRVRVGSRVLLAGTGPFLLSVACALLDVGARVVGVVEANHPYRLDRRAFAALRYPARLRELTGYLAALARHRVPLWQGRYVLGATGPDRVRTVVLGRTTGPATPVAEVHVDALCVGYGFRPSVELARLLGCAMRPDPLTGELLPETTVSGRTSREDVYVVGEAAGIAGVYAAQARGRLAATEILARFGRPVSPSVQRRTRREVARWARFASLTAERYPLPVHLLDNLPGDTVVCRCEHVTAAEIRATAVVPYNDLNATKGLCRAGMGPCQGRECGMAVNWLTRQARHGADRPAEAFTARMPVKPVPLTTVMDVVDPDSELTR